MKGSVNSMKRLISIICVMVFLISLLAGCGKNSTGGNSINSESGKSDNVSEGKTDNYDISIMLPNFQPEFPGNDSPIVKKLDEYTNTKIDLKWVPSSSYEDKFNISLAGGDLAKVMAVLSKSPSFINAVNSGAFWELGPYLKDYENLSQANPIILNNASINGKTYGIYRARTLGRMGVTYRKDWLEKLGMDVPKTIDDFYKMLKGFTYDDPDGNSKDDTYGMVVSKYAGPWDIMQIWFGVPNKWGIDKNGKLVPAHMTPEYMDALKFFKKLYDEKLVNPDFAVMDAAKWGDPMVNGQAGTIVDVADQAQRISKKIADKDPNKPDAIGVFGAVEGPKGLRNLPTSGYSGMLAIPKLTVKTEEDLHKVLTFLDKLNDKEGQTLLGNGIEGRHYTLDKDGYSIPTEDKVIGAENNSLNQMLMYIPEDRSIKVQQTPIRIKVAEVQKANENIVVPNPAEPLVSEVYAQKGAQLDNIVNDARIKFIVGQIDEAGFNSAIELWSKSGGEEYINEINKLYTATLSNAKK